MKEVTNECDMEESDYNTMVRGRMSSPERQDRVDSARRRPVSRAPSNDRTSRGRSVGRDGKRGEYVHPGSRLTSCVRAGMGARARTQSKAPSPRPPRPTVEIPKRTLSQCP